MKDYGLEEAVRSILEEETGGSEMSEQKLCNQINRYLLAKSFCYLVMHLKKGYQYAVSGKRNIPKRCLSLLAVDLELAKKILLKSKIALKVLMNSAAAFPELVELYHEWRRLDLQRQFCLLLSTLENLPVYHPVRLDSHHLTDTVNSFHDDRRLTEDEVFSLIGKSWSASGSAFLSTWIVCLKIPNLSNPAVTVIVHTAVIKYNLLMLVLFVGFQVKWFFSYYQDFITEHLSFFNMPLAWNPALKR